MKKLLFKLFITIFMLSATLFALMSCNNTTAKYTLSLDRISTGEGYDKSDIAVALLLNEDGRVVLCRIDEIVPDSGEALSKKALGDAYGMKEAGALAEWDDQVAHLERWLIGKSKDEIIGADKDAADLRSGCTIETDNIISAVISTFESENKTEIESSGDVAIALALNMSDSEGEHILTATALAMVRGYTLATLADARLCK